MSAMRLPADFLWKWQGALQQCLLTLESAPTPVLGAQLLSLCEHTGCFRLCREEHSLSDTGEVCSITDLESDIRT